MILLFVRHGEANGEGNASLSAEGKKQAVSVAKKLSGIRITKAFTSDYCRAQETCAEYQKLRPTTPIERTVKLREIYRVIIGGPAKQGTRPNRVAEDTVCADDFFKELLSAKDNDVIAVFCHGNIIRYFLAKALGVSPEIMWSRVLLNCGSLSIIQVKNKNMSVKMINGIGHLPEKETSLF